MSIATAPPTPAGPAAARDLAREISDQHTDLRRRLAALRGVTDLPRVVTELTALRPLLAAHFAAEEAPRGLYEAVGCAEHVLPRLDALLAEHASLLVELDLLLARAVACLEGPLADVLEGVSLLSHRLHVHERAEEEALADSVYVECGRG